MHKLKRIALYGVSGTGKTTILKDVSNLSSKVIWLEGSKLILDTACITLVQFKKLSDKEKYYFREKAIERAFEIQAIESKHIIIDGHLVFANGESVFENVMTQKDAIFYTDYIYLRLPVDVIFNRLQNDKERKRSYSKTAISNWMQHELHELKMFCQSNSLNLHILETVEKNECVDFICEYIEK